MSNPARKGIKVMQHKKENMLYRRKVSLNIRIQPSTERYRLVQRELSTTQYRKLTYPRKIFIMKSLKSSIKCLHILSFLVQSLQDSAGIDIQ